MFQEIPFYNVPIEKPKIKILKNVDMLIDLAFYDELNVVKTKKTLKKYARSCIIEIMKNKDEKINDP